MPSVTLKLTSTPCLQVLNSGIPWEVGGHQFFFREIYESIEGQKTILSSTPIGYVVVSIDTQLLMASQEEKIFNTMLVIVFSLFVASWLAIRFTRSISQPIESLHNMVEKMMVGELDSLAEEAGPHEVQLLANGINQLAVTIRDSNFRIAKRDYQSDGAVACNSRRVRGSCRGAESIFSKNESLS